MKKFKTVSQLVKGDPIYIILKEYDTCEKVILDKIESKVREVEPLWDDPYKYLIWYLYFIYKGEKYRVYVSSDFDYTNTHLDDYKEGKKYPDWEKWLSTPYHTLFYSKECFDFYKEHNIII